MRLSVGHEIGRFGRDFSTITQFLEQILTRRANQFELLRDFAAPRRREGQKIVRA
jgi:hypothetical protein